MNRINKKFRKFFDMIVPIKNSTELFTAAEKILYNKELSENIVKEAIEISKEPKIPFILKKVKNYLMKLKVTNPIKFNNHIFLRNKSFKFCS